MKTKKCLPWALSSVLALILGLTMVSAQPEKKSENFWLLQARVFTDSLLSDAVALDRFDRALVLGHLARTWWKDDREHALIWIEKAIESVEPPSSSETKAERRRRLSAARALFKIAAGLDKAPSDRLASLFLTDSVKPDDEDAANNATGLADAGLEVLNHDPKRSFELGLASLRSGRSSRFTALLWNSGPEIQRLVICCSPKH